MSCLITGGSGILGNELKKVFSNSLTPSHNELDITKKSEITKYLENNSINTIIHTAALTKIRICEENKKLSWETNVVGTKNIVDVINETKSNIKLIFVSTACVFDGHTGMYKESSIPCPENFYALTKLIAEQYASQIENQVTIRTNFVAKKIWPYSKAFTDRYGTYLFAENVAKGIKEIDEDGIKKIVHVVGDRKISMYELAKITTPNIEPITIEDYVGPKLTMDMSLDTERWKRYKIF